MFSKFSEEARKILLNMQKEMTMLKHPYIGSEHLLLSILKYGNSDDLKILKSFNITYDTFRSELIKIVGIGKNSNNYFLYTPLLRSILDNASNICKENNSIVDSTTLLFAILDEGEGVAIRILLGMGVDIDSLYDAFDEDEVRSYGGKLLVETYGYSLNEKAKSSELDPVIGRDEELNRVIEVLLRRTKNNPLLIGDAGVGKTAIVEELARRIELGLVPGPLKNKNIISVSMANLVAGTKYRGEFEEKLSKMLSELEKNPNIILFIDEIHTLVGAGGAEGAIDASNIFKPALARGKIKVIGATTTAEYKETILKDKALSRRFQNVIVKETNLELTKDILLKLRPIYESFHKVKVSDFIIERIIYFSNKYITNRRMPDKAIDVLDEVCSRASSRDDGNIGIYEKLVNELELVKKDKNKAIVDNNFELASSLRKKELELESKKNKLELKDLKDKYKEVFIDDVDYVVSKLSNVPIFGNNSGMLKTLKTYLLDNVIGQNLAIEELCKSTKKARCGIKVNDRPYSFLFVGKSGVGKTLLAKCYAKYLYGKDNFIRLDMSEYKEAHAISKIIGSPPGYVGYSDNKNICELVKDNPYSVILLDEIEKAHSDVINLFLQILDEGVCKDSKGEEVNFSNTVIIITSNLGCEKESIGFGNDNIKCNYKIREFLGDSFVNRIDKIIHFKELNKADIKKIVSKKINDIREKQNISFNISDEDINNIVNNSEFNLYGARKIDKLLEDNMDNYVKE